MIEVIFFGRGGQGAMTASRILAASAFQEGKYAQAFPSFSPERRGAPVTAYTRISANNIIDRSPIMRADCIIVMDPTGLKLSNPLDQLKKNGWAIINGPWTADDVQQKMKGKKFKAVCIDATRISEHVYGKRPIPITNIAMLGAFASATKLVRLDSILSSIDEFFSDKDARQAKEAAQIAYNELEGIRSP